MKCGFAFFAARCYGRLSSTKIGTVKGILLFRALMNLSHFLLFCLIGVKFATVKLLSDIRFLILTSVKAHFTWRHK